MFIFTDSNGDLRHYTGTSRYVKCSLCWEHVMSKKYASKEECQPEECLLCYDVDGFKTPSVLNIRGVHDTERI